MPDPTNDIDALLKYLSIASRQPSTTILGGFAADCHAALAALIAERDSLKQRVAVLESQEFTLPHDPFRDPDRDLRERLVCAIWPEILRIFERTDTTHNNGANWELVRINARDRALTEADAMLAAMRKGDGDGK